VALLDTDLPDAARLSRAVRAAAAARIRGLPDIDDWPDLKWFNSEPCAEHAPDLLIFCRRCGIKPRKHQRVGAAWMYLGLPGLLTDAVGLGKTATALLLLAMCKETGELGLHNRAVIVCKSAATWDPWGNELKRVLPGISFYVADGDRNQRTRGYMGNWEIAVVGDRTLGGAHGKKMQREGDVDLLDRFPVGILIYDDIDPMRNHTTETARAVNRLAAKCSRVHGLHATPLQKRLEELWSFLEPVGGRYRLGTIERVKSRYVAQAMKWIVVKDPQDKTGRTRMRKRVAVDAGIVANPRLVREFREAIWPLVLRRGAADVDDVEMPQVVYDPVFLDLSPKQRARYAELSRGILRRLSDAGARVSTAEAGAAFTRARQICSGLAALDSGADADDSVKLDWAMDRITGDLSEEKAVCFIYFKQNVAAMSARLQDAGIDHVLMWSGETDKRERRRRLERFREDPACRVLVGTTTIEASLNLQVARHLIAADTIPNPARMTQLAGRVARQGSPYPSVYFHHLLARNTVEEAFLPMLRREAAMAEVVWDEEEGMFTSLSPWQLMRLVATGKLDAEPS
jgi:SNF2 family DNA or RNA helicase